MNQLKRPDLRRKPEQNSVRTSVKLKPTSSGSDWIQMALIGASILALVQIGTRGSVSKQSSSLPPQLQAPAFEVSGSDQLLRAELGTLGAELSRAKIEERREQFAIESQADKLRIQESEDSLAREELALRQKETAPRVQPEWMRQVAELEREAEIVRRLNAKDEREHPTLSRSTGPMANRHLALVNGYQSGVFLRPTITACSLRPPSIPDAACSANYPCKFCGGCCCLAEAMRSRSAI